MKLLTAILLLLSFAHAHEAGETEAQIGPGKAVEAFDEERGIKLSEKAKKTLEIKTIKLSSASAPNQAILSIRDRSAVYVLSDGWFKLIDLHDVKPGDEVVVHGTALLRVAQLNVDMDHEDKHEDEHHD